MSRVAYRKGRITVVDNTEPGYQGVVSVVDTKDKRLAVLPSKGVALAVARFASQPKYNNAGSLTIEATPGDLVTHYNLLAWLTQ
jgi:hypothetical protein